ncbi:unnamed protein product [Nezara viridula]|uniref:Uncharacterized protein n=1 Tax=Nezara viridula TaxID=85310 RepID=A0A9P0MG61_NEZVI|nr:unnamed protein product [Nezara viridula]
MITEATMAPFAGIRHSGVMAINMVFQAAMVSVAFAAFLTNMNLLARLCRVPPRSEVEGGGRIFCRIPGTCVSSAALPRASLKRNRKGWGSPLNILLGGVQTSTPTSPSFLLLQLCHVPPSEESKGVGFVPPTSSLEKLLIYLHEALRNYVNVTKPAASNDSNKSSYVGISSVTAKGEFFCIDCRGYCTLQARCPDHPEILKHPGLEASLIPAERPLFPNYKH